MCIDFNNFFKKIRFNYNDSFQKWMVLIMQYTIETVIHLDEKKYKKIKKIAEEKRKSISAIIEERVDDMLTDLSSADSDGVTKNSQNPLLDIIGICNTGLGDAAVNHDKYIYGKNKI